MDHPGTDLSGPHDQDRCVRDDGLALMPPEFFGRADDTPDGDFYGPVRLVTHIDDAAIAEVTRLYRQLALGGDVLDLMSSWVSHFDPAPTHLTVLGMNAAELERNPAAHKRVVHDLNREPQLPFADASFDVVACCVSVDYLVAPFDVFADVARVLRPGGPFVCTFSNRCFPTKAIRGWLANDDAGRVTIVATYFARTPAFAPATAELRNPRRAGDPLYAVWARRRVVNDGGPHGDVR